MIRSYMISYDIICCPLQVDSWLIFVPFAVEAVAPGAFLRRGAQSGAAGWTPRLGPMGPALRRWVVDVGL
jgi:hypothetical protein